MIGNRFESYNVNKLRKVNKTHSVLIYEYLGSAMN